MIKLKDGDLNFAREIRYAKEHIWSPKHLALTRKHIEEYWRHSVFKIHKWNNERVFNTPCAPLTPENKAGFSRVNRQLKNQKWIPIRKT